MFLLIDIGNTKTKWMLRDNHGIYKHDSFLTEDIDQDHFEFDVAIKKVFISNVAGFEKEAILKIKLKKFSCPVKFIKPQKKYKYLLNGYQEPTTLGADRWLSALSVSHDIKKPAVIVSVGTAVTIDYVSYDQKNNQYSFEGGVILPGLHLTKNALANNTADLKSSEGIVQMPPINTASAIQTGFVLSVIGNIKFLFDQASSESQDVAIILSGGDAELIEQHMDKSLKKYVSTKKDLVLEGLFIFASH